MNDQKSFGLVIEPLVATDFVAGDGKLAGEVINPLGDWLPLIPQYEHQAPQFETNACASFGTLNAFEILHKFVFGEELNLSDRFLAKVSGTNPKIGNSPQKVALAFRKNWSALQEDWPMEGVQSADEFYKEPPDLVYSKATIVKGDNVWGYEAVTNPTKLKLKEALTKGAVCISVAAWTTDENGVYYKPQGFRDNHWTTLLNIRPDGNYTILDSYAPYIKIYRGDAIPEIAYRYTLDEELVDALTRLIRALRAWLGL